MKRSVILFMAVISFSGLAVGQSFDLWLFNGLGNGSQGYSVTSKNLGNLSSVTRVADATGTGGFIYRDTDWSDKWTATVSVNTASGFTNAGGNSPDGEVPVVTGKYYTFNVPSTPQIGNNSQLFSILETSSQPVVITMLTRDIANPTPDDAVTVSFSLSSPLPPDQYIYIVYSSDSWATTTVSAVTVAPFATSATYLIPAQTEGTTLSYYGVISPLAPAEFEAITSDEERNVMTLTVNNNSGSNYSYLSTSTPDETAPTIVTDLAVTTVTDIQSITLTWTPVTEESFDTYEIYYSTNPGVTTGDMKYDKSNNFGLSLLSTSSAKITGLTGGTTYYFAIRAIDLATNASDLSNEVNATTLPAPTIAMDGVFEGTLIWGEPIATGDGNPGWVGVNVSALYMTTDDNYVYFGAEVAYDNWQRFAFLINTIPGQGGSSSATDQTTTYGHTELPDFAIVKNSNDAYLKTWDGSSWNNNQVYLQQGIWSGFSISPSINSSTFVEVFVQKSVIGDVSNQDVQFYIAGNDDSHSSFDSAPSDNIMTWWGSPVTLSMYASTFTVPVELSSFTGKAINGQILLSWTTATETNNAGFEIEVLGSGSIWTQAGFIAGKGTTTEKQIYSFSLPVSGKSLPVTLRLKQVDLNGKSSYSPVIEISGYTAESFTLAGSYPNPFNPSATVQFTLPVTGSVEFSVFNSLGQLVSTEKINGTAGLNSVSFNGTGLSSGLYLYQIRFNNQVKQGSMTLIK